MASISYYCFPTHWGVVNPSPFCTKLEGYMRTAGIDYTKVELADPRKMPKGKLPIIEHNGQKIPDSNFIIDYFKANNIGRDIDAHLSAKEQAEHYMIRMMLDDHLYFVLMYNRWVIPSNWKIIQKNFFNELPALIRPLITAMIRKGTIATLQHQGTSRHSEDEVATIGIKACTALRDYLGDREWFGNDQVSTLDLCALSYLENFARVPMKCAVQTFIQNDKVLMDYTERGIAHVFGNAS